MHSQYEELCALAVTGQATDSELALLDEHLEVCDDCRTLVERVDLRGSRLGPSLAELFRVDAEPPVGMRDRFLRRAAEEGLQIQPGRSMPVSGIAVAGMRRTSSLVRCWRSFLGWRMSPGFSMAAGCLVVGSRGGQLAGLEA